MSEHYTVKQVILMRRDLRTVEGHKVRSGKLMVQAAHASMAWLANRLHGDGRNVGHIFDDVADAGKWVAYGIFTTDETAWLLSGSFAKIVVGVENQTELEWLVKKAVEAGISAEIITDAGHTEFGGVPTVTCAGVGPAAAKEIDKITAHLKPY